MWMRSEYVYVSECVSVSSTIQEGEHMNSYMSE